MAEKEMSLKELQEENLRIQNAHLLEQTEFYREQNELSRQRRADRLRQHSTQEETLAANRKRDIVIWKGCTHRKGGKGDDLVNNRGNDPNYSVVKHQYSLGDWSVLCTRCFAEWKPGDTAATHPTGISFQTALEWPTDNASSGAVQFRLPDRRPELQTVAK